MSKLFHFSMDERNSETLLVDHRGQLYIVSKSSNGRGRVYELPDRYWGRSSRAKLSGSKGLEIRSDRPGPVGGDISPKGDEILIKTYEKIFYYKVKNGDIMKTLDGRPDGEVSYTRERQGEAVCWSSNADGYYTLSEGRDQPLYYYERD